jgi:hypothetical protein
MPAIFDVSPAGRILLTIMADEEIIFTAEDAHFEKENKPKLIRLRKRRQTDHQTCRA